jgi:flagellar basal-body rod protein FlgF
LKNIWVPVSGAIAQEKNVEVMANNVANANTPGFKKDQLTFREYLTALEKNQDTIDLPDQEWRPEDFYRTQGAENAYVKTDASHTIHDQGALTPTGNPLDVAINGPGFFEILTPQGIRYTRKGNFSLSKDGNLVTDQGYFVLSKINWPGEINPSAKDTQNAAPPPEQRKITVGSSGQVVISTGGEVSVNNNKVADLAVTEFNNLHVLKKEGNVSFINDDVKNIKTKGNSSIVQQGFLEESNVNAIAEISNLIKANRHFESIQRAIKAYDSMTGRGVNEISKL